MDGIGHLCVYVHNECLGAADDARHPPNPGGACRRRAKPSETRERPGWPGSPGPYELDSEAKSLILYRKYGARGIRTLEAACTTYRISKSREPGARRGTGGHLVFKIAEVGALRGRRRHPRWNSVGAANGRPEYRSEHRAGSPIRKTPEVANRLNPKRRSASISHVGTRARE